MPWFGGFIGDWFIGCVFFSPLRERERGENFKGRLGCKVIFLNLFFKNHIRSNRNAKYILNKKKNRRKGAMN
jgi:hypothetical protein